MSSEGKKGSWVYMMRCSGGRLYTGWTNDLENRVEAHISGKGAKFTKAFKAEALAYAEELEDKSTGLKREAALKRLSKAEKEELCALWAAQERGNTQ